MDKKILWISQMTEQTLALEYLCGGVTRVIFPHDTGWRTLPGTAMSFIQGYKGVFHRPKLPDVFICPGQALIVPQGQHHRVEIVGRKGGVSRWSHISFNFLGGIDVFSLLEVPTIITGSPARRIGEINEELVALHAGEALPHWVIRRKALALELLSIPMEQSTVLADRLPAGDAMERLGGVLELISKNLSTPTDVEEMARTCALSVSRFHATFKSVMGVSPGRYLQDLRLLRARQLLLTGNMPVKAVSAESGFGDVFHFSRIFRKRCGTSPSAYRIQVRTRQSF